MNPHIVIVGAGQAGVQSAEALRAGGFTGEITLLGAEPYGPYHRPPLSKAWLAGEMDAAQLVMRAPEMLAKKQITLRTDIAVRAIDTAAHTVRLADETTLGYTGLVLATGATPRMLPIPGASLPGVLPLRSRNDAAALAERFALCAEHGWPVVVIGGGFIGLEVAATARKKQLAVTVLEAAPRLMARVLPPLLSDWYAALHRERGVNLVLEARIASIEATPDGALAVIGADGTRWPAGVVVMGVGVAANDRLAQAAGIACERGIVVDACGRTSARDVVAAGDCTARRLPDGSLLRLESVNNATEQGKSAAAALLGQERPFTSTPWFWSDQYDRKLQMAGLSMGSEQWAVRGDMGGASFSIYHYRAGRLIAVDSINAPKDHLLARKLIEAGVSPTPRQAADAGFDLASLMAG